MKPLARDLLVPGKNSFCPAEADGNRLRSDRVHGSVHHISLTLDVLLVLRVTFGFAQSLKDHLFSRLGRHAAEILRRRIDQRHASHFGLIIEL